MRSNFSIYRQECTFLTKYVPNAETCLPHFAAYTGFKRVRCDDDQRAAERAAYRSYINNPISDQSFFENYGGRVVSTELEEIFNAMLIGKLPAKWAKSFYGMQCAAPTA